MTFPAAVPLLITLDVHAHDALEEVLLASAESFGHAKHRVSYFVPASFAQERNVGPTLRLLRKMGHTIGCHGFKHSHAEDLPSLDASSEFNLLQKATCTLADVLGESISSFRSPSYRISTSTLGFLSQLGYKADLSITPQHFPLFSSSPWQFGRLQAPRSPYHPSPSNPFRPGELSILEIPTSCFVVPLAHGSLSALPMLAWTALAKLLAAEARSFGRVLVPMFHPESVVGRDGVWSFPPLRVSDFFPRSHGGIRARYKLLTLNPKTLYSRTSQALNTIRDVQGVMAMSVDEFLQTRSIGNGCSSEAATHAICRTGFAGTESD